MNGEDDDDEVNVCVQCVYVCAHLTGPSPLPQQGLLGKESVYVTSKLDMFKNSTDQ